MNGRISRPTSGTAWKAVAVLWLLFALAYLDRQIISLLVAPIRQDLQISDFQISLLQGLSFALFYSICGLPLGFAVDRFPRRRVIFLGVIVWALAACACGLARNFSQLLAARFLVGAGEAALAPAAYSMLSDLFPRERLTFALSVYSIGAVAGAGLSLIFGVAVIHWFEQGVTLPMLGHLHAWQAAFLAAGLPGIPIAFLVFAIPEPPRGGSAMGFDGWVEVFRFLRSRSGFFGCHVVGFAGILTLAFGQLAWMPTFLSRTYHWPLTRIGMVWAIYGFVNGAVWLTFNGRLVDALQRRRIYDAHFRYYIVATTVTAIAGAIAFQLPAAWQFLLCFSFAMMGLNAAAVAASALQIVTPPALRGRISASFLLVSGLVSLTVGPSVVAFFTDYVFHADARIGASLSATFVTIAPIALLAFMLGLKPMRRAVALADVDADARVTPFPASENR